MIFNLNLFFQGEIKQNLYGNQQRPLLETIQTTPNSTFK
jgi:hypothetical protein